MSQPLIRQTQELSDGVLSYLLPVILNENNSLESKRRAIEVYVDRLDAVRTDIVTFIRGLENSGQTASMRAWSNIRSDVQQLAGAFRLQLAQTSAGAFNSRNAHIITVLNILFEDLRDMQEI